MGERDQPLPERDDPDTQRTNRAREEALAPGHSPGVNLAEAASLLTALARRGAAFVVVGSLARHWLSPEASAQTPHDVDILVPNEIDSLNRLVQWLIEFGFAVYSWQERVCPPLDVQRLERRFYLRAVRVSGLGTRLVLDATYESPLLSFAEAWGRRLHRLDIGVASPEDLDRFQWPRSRAGAASMDEGTAADRRASMARPSR
jgi:hypothetical protein